MCTHTQCQRCYKLTWTGCGMHLEELFKKIKYEDRCWCGYDTMRYKTRDFIKEHKKIHPNSKSGPFPKHQVP